MEKNVPEIRFNGFSGEWAQRPFGDCFDNIPNNTLSRADLNYEHGIAKNVHYGDVLIKFGEILDASDTSIPFVTDENVVSKQKHAALKNGDIVIADAAEDSTVGKCTELFNIDEQVILSGLHTIAVRPNLPFASKYLGYYLNSSSYHDQLLPLLQGTKVLSISKTALKNTSVNFPSANGEQIQIGNYFQKLNTLINQHQQKHDKLSKIKKAMLEKMFPKQGETLPEVRFKGFCGEWEEKELKEICTYHSSTLTVNDTEAEGQYKLYDAQKSIGYTDRNIQDTDYITIIKDGSGVGRVRVLPKNTSFIATMGAIKPKETDLHFLYCCLIKIDFNKHISGATIPHVYFRDYGREKFRVPKFDEQTQIGNYFQKLDALINQHQQQITKLKNIKQACLSKMFV